MTFEKILMLQEEFDYLEMCKVLMILKFSKKENLNKREKKNKICRFTSFDIYC